MANPTNVTYSSANKTPINGGQTFEADAFGTVTQVSTDSNAPNTTPGQYLIVELHGSGGQNTTTGTQYSADVSGTTMAYGAYTAALFSTVKSVQANSFILRPVDLYGYFPNLSRRESMWIGMQNAPTANVAFITWRRITALLKWGDANLSYAASGKRYLTGGSMGGWGSLLYGIHHVTKFAAVYPDRPRWRSNYTLGHVAVTDYNTLITDVPNATAPNMTPNDGGTSIATFMDNIAFAANTANKIPWLGWCVGRQDGYVQFQDHIDAVAAMRAANRGFAFVWNNGNHTTGSILSQIWASYPFGMFTIGVGYPLFTNHSGDQDPNVDLVGGINEGLSFRNVVESSSSWQCDVTSVLGARTVNVKPISDIFTKVVSSQLATIPAANSWVTLTFT